jgi:hypothetical protein
MSTSWERMDRWCDRAAPVLAAIATIAVFWLGMAYGSRAAGGADAFGYVSQAYLWLNGDLRIDQSWSKRFEWPHREESVRPLGYRWGEDRRAIVPTYAPGVPLIMAGFDRVFGACGPYYVTPFFGALLVAGTFVLGRRLGGSRLTASIAALLMAGSPAFLFNLMFPMSDIVTASLWTWMLVLLTWPNMAGPTVGGIVAGVAVLVRPNLVPLAIAGVAAAALWSGASASRARRLGRVVAFGAWIVPASLFIARLNHTLYGSAFESGYGGTSTLYAISHFATNLMHYAGWLTHSESPLLVIAILPVVFRQMRPDWLTLRVAIPVALFVAIVLASYLFYLPFEEWWYLRFLLPAFPILFLLLATAIERVSRAAGLRPVCVPIFIVLLLCGYRWSFAVSRGLMRIGYDEQRYVAVGQYIARALPPNAILLAMQHSGTIRYYAGRPTIRYDLFTPARLPTVIAALPGYGYRPYIVLEDWEEKEYRARMGNDSPIARLEMRVMAEMTAPVKIRIYDPQPAGAGAPPPDPIPIRPTRTCVGPGGVWAQ